MMLHLVSEIRTNGVKVKGDTGIAGSAARRHFTCESAPLTEKSGASESSRAIPCSYCKASMWSFRSRILIVQAALAAAATAGTGKPVVAPYEIDAQLAPHGKIDELVFANWKRLRIQPANPCSDEVFVRRVYLDVIGTLPTPEEASQFLKDGDPAKRSALIDRLLDRREFAD